MSAATYDTMHKGTCKTRAEARPIARSSAIAGDNHLPAVRHQTRLLFLPLPPLLPLLPGNILPPLLLLVSLPPLVSLLLLPCLQLLLPLLLLLLPLLLLQSALLLLLLLLLLLSPLHRGR